MKYDRNAVRWSAAAMAVLGFASMTAVSHAAASPLTTAKTVEVTEIFSKVDENGVLKPQYKMTVDIAPKRGVKVFIHPANPKSKIAYYIANPKKEFEYYGDQNEFREIQPDDNGHASSQIRYLGCVDLLQNGGNDAAEDAKRTVSQVVLDGKKMILQSDARTHTDKGVVTVYIDDLWRDAATGLPYRRTGYSVTGEKRVANLSVDFVGWTFNKALPSSFFDFTPPAGAVPLFTPVPLAAGVVAPDFTAIRSDGTTVHLSDLKGKIVVLDFWATWCNPCQQSMPHLDQVYKSLQGQDVVVLAVCVWDKETLYKRWVAAKAQVYSFPTAFDPAADGEGDNIARTLYKITAIPATYIIGKDGVIAEYISGHTSDNDHRLEDGLTKLGVTLTPPAAATTTGG